VIGAALGYAMQGMLATVRLITVISPDIVAMDEARLAALQKFYVEQGIIEKTLPVKDHYTNQFVE